MVDKSVTMLPFLVLLILFYFFLTITKEESYKNLPALTRQTLEDTNTHTNAVKYLLVGNTTDRPEERQIPFETSKRFANERGLVYLEANIDNPNEVDKAFVSLSEEIAQIRSVKDHSLSSPKQHHNQCNSNVEITKLNNNTTINLQKKKK
eukprot:TRINITY_DN6063_c0_g1_i1.p1 TRINITY_DN6063_c0_g1~~TRINITY_DN6063_c0_g1_i1.p1  ORF type:complete len:150 (+),score=25.22 TRINITY_DN6063_c0_g1_i1:214-663(+)